MSISLLCVSTARDSATIPIPSLRMRRFLPSICSGVLPEILQHQGDTYFRQGVSVIMVSKIAVLSNVLRTPKYALRGI